MRGFSDPSTYARNKQKRWPPNCGGHPSNRSLSWLKRTPPPQVALVPATVLPPRDFTRVFSTEDSDAVAPVTIRQNMPRFPGNLTTPAQGVIEVIIDAAGAADSVRMLESVHPQYDALVTSAAKRWQYQPAHVAGTNVRYLKRIQISLAPPNQGSSGRR